jgi:hypothetical protein
MGNKFERSLLRFLFLFGIITFFNIIRKPPVKDWLLIFLLKGYISSILDKFIVRNHYINYPIKLINNFDISFIFDYLLFPISCVYYNQITKGSKIIGILLKVFLFSIPMAITEYLLEKHTNVVQYKRGWNSFISFGTLTITFLLVRLLIALIRVVHNKTKREIYES